MGQEIALHREFLKVQLMLLNLIQAACSDIEVRTKLYTLSVSKNPDHFPESNGINDLFERFKDGLLNGMTESIKINNKDNYAEIKHVDRLYTVPLLCNISGSL